MSANRNLRGGLIAGFIGAVMTVSVLFTPQSIDTRVINSNYLLSIVQQPEREKRYRTKNIQTSYITQRKGRYGMEKSRL